MSDLTVERLRQLLSYDPETGIFSWRCRRGGTACKGSRAGALQAKGYWRIRIDFRLYKASRLAWLYMTGQWPQKGIDHINRVRCDDRWCNLREATQSENMQNSSVRKDNKLGVKGVYWDKGRKKYRAQVMRNGKSQNVGLFPTLEQAKSAHDKAARELHGEFFHA